MGLLGYISRIGRGIVEGINNKIAVQQVRNYSPDFTAGLSDQEILQDVKWCARDVTGFMDIYFNGIIPVDYASAVLMASFSHERRRTSPGLDGLVDG